ncbi:hypothetical protein HDU93_003700 [Gonapodya sp. JEL0774]|nr:hypothetical protein HDU93_003700 [Gonapodya sp. JEL0774]
MLALAHSIPLSHSIKRNPSVDNPHSPSPYPSPYSSDASDPADSSDPPTPALPLSPSSPNISHLSFSQSAFPMSHALFSHDHLFPLSDSVSSSSLPSASAIIPPSILPNHPDLLLNHDHLSPHIDTLDSIDPSELLNRLDMTMDLNLSSSTINDHIGHNTHRMHASVYHDSVMHDAQASDDLVEVHRDADAEQDTDADADVDLDLNMDTRIDADPYGDGDAYGVGDAVAQSSSDSYSAIARSYHAFLATAAGPRIGSATSGRDRTGSSAAPGRDALTTHQHSARQGSSHQAAHRTALQGMNPAPTAPAASGIALAPANQPTRRTGAGAGTLPISSSVAPSFTTPPPAARSRPAPPPTPSTPSSTPSSPLTPPPALTEPCTPALRTTHLALLKRHLDATHLNLGVSGSTAPPLPYTLRILGVPLLGARSRVETQTRICIQLCPAPATPFSDADAASTDTKPPPHITRPPFSHLRLPLHTLASRERVRRSRADKEAGNTPGRGETAGIEAVVVCATGGGAGWVGREVECCGGCVGRELKRIRPRPSDPSPSPSHNLPRDDDPILTQPTRRILLFNANEYVDFSGGGAILPTRVTCYCRHWDEKVGFCIYFILRDHTGTPIATGLSPPILVTDDHKSQVKSQSQGMVVGKIVGGVGNSTGTGTGSGTGAFQQVPLPVLVQVQQVPIQQMRKRQRLLDEEEEYSAGWDKVGARPVAKPRKRNTGNGKGDGNAGAGAGSPPTSAGFANGGVKLSSSVVQRHTSVKRESPPPASQPAPEDAPSPAMSVSSAHLPGSYPASPPPQSQAVAPLSSGITRTDRDQDRERDRRTPPRRTTGTPVPGPPASSAHPPPPVVEADGAMYIGYGYDEDRVASAGFNAVLSRAGSGGYPHGAISSAMDISMPMTMSPAPETGGGGEVDLDAEPLAVISRVVPGEGPVGGGVDVTVLGRGFREGLTVLFGDVPAPSVQFWNSNTLVVILPPARLPGPVVVGFKEIPAPVDSHLGGDGMPLFVYKDDSDRALLELALQVVGVRLSGTIEDARNVALRIIAEQTAGLEIGNGAGANPVGTLPAGLAAALALAAPMPKRELEMAVAAAVMGATNEMLLAKNSRGMTMAHLAMACDMPALLGALNMAGGVEVVEAKCLSGWGWTPLQMGIWLGRVECVEVLLRAGCDWEATDDAGRRWQEIVAMAGEVPGVRRVLERWEAEQNITWDEDDEVVEDDDDDQWVTDDEDERTQYSEEDATVGVDGAEVGPWFVDEAVSERTAGDCGEVPGAPALHEEAASFAVPERRISGASVASSTGFDFDRPRSRSTTRLVRTPSMTSFRGVPRRERSANARIDDRRRSSSRGAGSQHQTSSSTPRSVNQRSSSFGCLPGISITPLVPLDERHGDGVRQRQHKPHKRQHSTASAASVLDYPPNAFPTSITAPAEPPQLQRGLLDKLPWSQGGPQFQIPSLPTFHNLPTFENPFTPARWQEAWGNLPQMPQMPGFPHVELPNMPPWAGLTNIPQFAGFPYFLHFPNPPVWARFPFQTTEDQRDTIPGASHAFPAQEQNSHPVVGAEGWFRRDSIFGIVPEHFKWRAKSSEGPSADGPVTDFIGPRNVNTGGGSSADTAGATDTVLVEAAPQRESVLFSFWLPVLAIMMMFAMSRFIVDNHQVIRTLSEFVTFAVLGGRAPTGYAHGGGGGGGWGAAGYTGFGNNDGPPFFEVVAAA